MFSFTSSSSDDGSVRRATSTINDAIREVQKTDDGEGAAWGSRGGTFLSARHVALIENYDTMCCAVLIARQNGGAWRSKEAVKLRSIGLFSEKEVLNELGIIAWPNSCSEPITLDRDSL